MHLGNCKYVKRVGESCTLNNNCRYPRCVLEKGIKYTPTSVEDFDGKIDWTLLDDPNLMKGTKGLFAQIQDAPIRKTPTISELRKALKKWIKSCKKQ